MPFNRIFHTVPYFMSHHRTDTITIASLNIRDVIGTIYDTHVTTFPMLDKKRKEKDSFPMPNIVQQIANRTFKLATS